MIIICFATCLPKFINVMILRLVQASHSTPVARIGGLSIMIALVFAAMPFLEILLAWSNYICCLLSAFPVFVVGFCEDLGYFSSPRIRLLAAVFRGLFCSLV